MAKSIGPNVGCTPPPMNIDTPEGCVADGETQYSYLWNMRDLQTIQEYKVFIECFGINSSLFPFNVTGKSDDGA